MEQHTRLIYEPAFDQIEVGIEVLWAKTFDKALFSIAWFKNAVSSVLDLPRQEEISYEVSEVHGVVRERWKIY